MRGGVGFVYLCFFHHFCVFLSSPFWPSPPPSAAPPPHAWEAPLSVMPLCGMTTPPRGEPSVPASIAAKFVVRQSRKKVRLTTKFFSIHGRKLGSPSGRAGAKRLRGEQKEKRPFPSAFPFCIFFVKYAPEIVPCGTLFSQDFHRPGEKFGPAFAARPRAGILVVDADHAAGLRAQLHLQRLLPV